VTLAPRERSVRGRVRGRSRRLAPSTAALVTFATLAACTPAPAARVEIAMHHSRFLPASVSVPHGRAVTFVLRNQDPIDHEWIVGDDKVHADHRTGTEPHHEARPTEVSVPALATVTTTVTFHRPGRLLFVCHLPGHEAYGMVGSVAVT
jgi:uncharacterized cupredoxin-like copper-binding protein